MNKNLGTTQKNYLKMHCVKSWVETRFKLKEPIVGEKEAGKDRTIVAKFSNCKGKQRVFNEVSCQKREDIHVYEDFSKTSVTIRKENWEKVKALRQQGKCTILVYDKIYSQDKLLANNLLKLSFN